MPELITEGEISKTKDFSIDLEGDERFFFPVIGPGNYDKVLSHVKEKNRRIPTSKQTFHLISFASNNREPHLKKILDILGEGWFWSSTRNYCCQNVIYVHTGSKIENNYHDFKKAFENEKMKCVDRRRTKTGHINFDEFLRDPLVLAHVKDDISLLENIRERFGVNDAYIGELPKSGDTATAIFLRGDKSRRMLYLGVGFNPERTNGYVVGVEK